MKNSNLKKLMIITVLSGLVLGGGTAFADDDTYLNTDSFATVQGDVGLARLDGHSSLAWSGGLGYQWVIADNFTAGFEGNYLNNGKVNQGNGVQVQSNLIAPMMVVDFYLTPSVNLMLKGGYGYAMNQYQLLGTVIHSNSWQPVGSVGLDYLMPVSNLAYLNLFVNATWVNQNTSASQGIVTNAGSVLQNIQYKTGVQFMF